MWYYNTNEYKGGQKTVDTNAIIVELFGRIKVLEEKVAELEKRNLETHTRGVDEPLRPAFLADEISAKYRPLAEFLYGKWEKRVVLTYGEIEDLLGFALPPSADKFPQSYWANTKTHSYATSWLCVGYKARVDGNARTVVFERTVL